MFYIKELNKRLIARCKEIDNSEIVKDEHKQKLCLEVVYNLMYGIANEMVCELEQQEEELDEKGLIDRTLNIAIEAVYSYGDDYESNSTNDRTLLAHYGDIGIDL